MRAVAMLPKDSPFRRGLPDTLRILDESGELEAVRSVSAVVDLPHRPYAVSVLTTYLRHDADGDAAIREISATLFETFDRFDRSSRPRPHHQRPLTACYPARPEKADGTVPLA